MRNENIKMPLYNFSKRKWGNHDAKRIYRGERMPQDQPGISGEFGFLPKSQPGSV